MQVNLALKEGYHGLPGGTTLADLLQEHRGVRNKQNLPRLDVEQILAWADAHREATGEYPHADSGPVRAAPGETWTAVHVGPEQGPPRPARRLVAGPAPGGAPRLPRPADRRAHPRLGRRPSRGHWPLADSVVVRAGPGRATPRRGRASTTRFGRAAAACRAVPRWPNCWPSTARPRTSTRSRR